MRRFPRSATSWLLVASLVVLFALDGAIAVSLLPSGSPAPGAPPSVVATRIAIVTGTSLPITATVTGKPSPTSTVVPTVAPPPTPTFTATPSPVPTPVPAPTSSVTQAPIVFDARRLKIGQSRQITTDDKFNDNQTSPADELLNYPVVSPWSPDSRYVLFRKMRSFNNNGEFVRTSDLYVAPVNGAPYLLVSNASTGTWSLDGRQIAYGISRYVRDQAASADTYFIVDVNGQNARRVMSALPSGYRRVYLADGTIALVQAGHVVVVDQQGAPIREMPHVAVVEDGIGGFLLSPDGSQIAFVTSSREPALKLASTRGGNAVTLPGWLSNLQANVAWSPDGNYIAYITTSPNELYVVAVDGKSSRRLLAIDTLPQLGMGNPTWSPDNRIILVGVRHGSQRYDVEMRAVNVDGSASARLLDGAWPERLSPDGRTLLLTQKPGNLWLAEVIP